MLHLQIWTSNHRTSKENITIQKILWKLTNAIRIDELQLTSKELKCCIFKFGLVTIEIQKKTSTFKNTLEINQ